MKKRAAGILMHITSLSGDYGIGTLGREAYEFVDFLKYANMRYWQILPFFPPAKGNSPYTVYSSFAGNPLFIDLDDLISHGLLSSEEVINNDWETNEDEVDFVRVSSHKNKLLKKAFKHFNTEVEDFKNFIIEEASWLEDYAAYMTLKNLFKDAPWYEWDKSYQDISGNKTKALIKDHDDIYNYHCFLQYLFYRQWAKLKKYAEEANIQLIGDLPIYVGLDSADVYSHKSLFCLDKDQKPDMVAGCPPDAYAPEGQKWNNPLYNWGNHQKDNYHWWCQRVVHALRLVDKLRIDHFRGFDAYFAIPYEGKAQDGHWIKGPGMDFFNILKKEIGDDCLIAEDLGFKTPSLNELLQESAYPGMKVLEFAFDSQGDLNSEYLPHNYEENTVAYAGTHDNDTLLGWLENSYLGDARYAKDYVGADSDEEFVEKAIKCLLMSKADTVILQAQDILKLGHEARMNTPSTVEGNWKWRARKQVFTYDLANRLAQEMLLYGRENIISH